MERTPGKWIFEITHLNGHQPHFTIRAGENDEIPIAVIHNSPHDSANAAYIVRAVNCHERLVEAVRAFRELMDHQEICYYRDPCSCHLDKQTIRRAKKKIDAALALAEGREE